MDKKQANMKSCLQPAPKVLVSCRGLNGENNVLVLEDCPVNIECKVVDSIVTGSHEMFVGKIEYVHADAELVDDKGDIDFSSISFI